MSYTLHCRIESGKCRAIDSHTGKPLTNWLKDPMAVYEKMLNTTKQNE